MDKRNKGLIVIVWLLLFAIVLASALALSGRKLVSAADYQIIQRYRRLDDVRSVLMDGYYEELNEEDLIQGAIDGMTASVGDEYTAYFTREEMQENDIELNGEYTGVGLLLERSETGDITVLRVYENSPALEAGVLPGDIIIDINGMNLTGVDAQGFEDAANEIRGISGTELTMKVLRSGEELSFVITRRAVVISNISWQMLTDKIGYIDIVQFGGNAVSGFLEAREQLQDARALIIDVRDNPGGLLDDVLTIADEILDECLIVYMEEKDGVHEDYFAQEGAWDIPVVVLVNGMSASASEILASTVQDNGRGIVIGTQSFGKGIAQSLMTFEDDGAGLQYTFARYFTPNGRNIHHIGVTPDIEVENAEGFVRGSAPDMENDAQLTCAVEYLSDLMEKNSYDE